MMQCGIVQSASLALGGSTMTTKFKRDSSNGLNVIAITKIQDGRRSDGRHLGFFETMKVAVYRPWGPHLSTKLSRLQQFNDNGAKIQDGGIKPEVEI
jgi:hypothetical protein